MTTCAWCDTDTADPCTCRVWCGHADCGADRLGFRWLPRLIWWRLRNIYWHLTRRPDRGA